MSTLACKCGHVMIDRTDSLPYKGRLLADQDWSWFLESLSRFAESVKLAKRKVQPQHADQLVRRCRHVYQCPECGRLYLQDSGNQYHAFLPEGDSPNKWLLEGVVPVVPPAP